MLTSQQGYLASDITKEHGLGSVRCPWLIKANPGQKVKLALYNFARSSKVIPDMAPESRPDICYEFASLRDNGKEKSLTACGGEDRVNLIHISETNVVEVTFVSAALLRKLGTFLLKYEGMYYIMLMFNGKYP